MIFKIKNQIYNFFGFDNKYKLFWKLIKKQFNFIFAVHAFILKLYFYLLIFKYLIILLILNLVKRNLITEK